jgi:hypothetical protein
MAEFVRLYRYAHYDVRIAKEDYCTPRNPRRRELSRFSFRVMHAYTTPAAKCNFQVKVRRNIVCKYLSRAAYIASGHKSWLYDPRHNYGRLGG